MPYIPQADRTKLDAFADGLSRNTETKGELTYVLTRLVLAYVAKHGKSYDSYSDVLGCLTATTHEVYRTEVAKYEEGKRRQNGDVCCGLGCHSCEDHGDTARDGW